MDTLNIPELIVWYVVFLFSTTLHEASHAWVAKLGGDLTAYRGGQVSLNPGAHIRREPFGMVIFPIIGLFVMGWPFGYASAPYNAEWSQRHPRRAALMALAGPMSNLLLCLLAVALIRAGYHLNYFSSPEVANYSRVTVGEGLAGHWALLLSLLFSGNLILGIFNLLPLPPLDGSAVLPFFLSRSLASRYQQVIANPAFGMVGLVLAWKVFEPIFDPVFTFCLNLLYPGISYG